MRRDGEIDWVARDRAREIERLHALEYDDVGLFGQITDFAARLFDVPNVGVHLLDDQRQFVKAFHGTLDTACSVEDAICNVPVKLEDVVVYPDTREEPMLAGNPFVWGADEPVRFYAGAPLVTSTGVTIGTLCLLDVTPRPDLEGLDTEALSRLASLSSEVLEIRRVARASGQLLDRAFEVDPTTGWLNQQGLLRALYRARTDRPDQRAIAVVDAGIDQFEDLRTAFGAGVRGRLLEACAERFVDAMPVFDASRGVLSERHPAAGASGGRERPVFGAHFGDGHFVFVRLFPGTTADHVLHDWAGEAMSDLVEAFREPFVDAANDVPVHLTLTLGHEVDGGGERPPHELIDDAQTAPVSRASEAAGGLAEASTDARDRRRTRITMDYRIRRAIEKREFHLAFQPIVDLRSGSSPIGAECLLRWTDGAGSVVGPSVFIPVAEEVGLIDDLDEIAMELAIEAQQRLRDHAPELWLSVNVSPRRVLSPRFADRMLFDADAAIDPTRMKLEITESGVDAGGAALTDVLFDLHDRGFQLALDDFGTGQSSLARVIRLPFDVLKVDRSFVADCPDGRGAAVVSSLPELAERLGMKTVGEGVETQAQEVYLTDCGYDFGQGYRYARPLPEEAFVDFVRESTESS